MFSLRYKGNKIKFKISLYKIHYLGRRGGGGRAAGIVNEGRGKILRE
jgi:hypothetical protein